MELKISSMSKTVMDEMRGYVLVCASAFGWVDLLWGRLPMGPITSGATFHRIAKRDDNPAGYRPTQNRKSRPLSGRLQLQSSKVNHWGVSPMIHSALQVAGQLEGVPNGHHDVGNTLGIAQLVHLGNAEAAGLVQVVVRRLAYALDHGAARNLGHRAVSGLHG